MRLLLAAALWLFGTLALANVIGSDFQNFNTTTNGIDFVTVQSGETLAKGILNTGVFINYSVNSLPEFKPNNKPQTEAGGGVRNQAAFSDFNLGLGVMKNWEVGISFPAMIFQDVKENNARLEYESKGLNEVRFNAKVKLVGSREHAFATVLTINQNLLQNNPYSGVNASPIVNLELVGHTSFNAVRAAINLGYRKKSPGDNIEEVPVEPFNDQWNASTAISYLFASIDTKLIFEFFGSGAVDPKKTDSEVFQKSGEALLGVKYDVTTALAMHVGGSTGIIESPVAPDYRIYAGVNWNAGPLYGKKPVRRKPKKRKRKKTAPAPEPEPIATFVFENIKFVFDSSKQVLRGSRAELQELSDYLNSLPAWSRVVVEGHTDSVGTDDYNVQLSERRAGAVRNHLIKNFNIPADKIEVIGYGESQPVADNDNYQGRQLNRRVEVKIYEDSAASSGEAPEAEGPEPQQ